MKDLDFYAFVESRDLFTEFKNEQGIIKGYSDNTKPFGNHLNAEMTLSLIATNYFNEIEYLFGVCDPRNDQDRETRINNINEHFGNGEHIYFLHLWFDLSSRLGDILRINLLPSQWHHIRLSPDAGYPVIRTREENLDEEGAEILFLSHISLVPEYILPRLTEIFSLNHVPDIDLNDDEEGGGQQVIKPNLGPDSDDRLEISYKNPFEQDEFGRITPRSINKKLARYYEKHGIDIIRLFSVDENKNSSVEQMKEKLKAARGEDLQRTQLFRGND